MVAKKVNDTRVLRTVCVRFLRGNTSGNSHGVPINFNCAPYARVLRNERNLPGDDMAPPRYVTRREFFTSARRRLSPFTVATYRNYSDRIKLSCDHFYGT